MEKFQLTIGGEQKEFTDMSEVQAVVDDLEKKVEDYKVSAEQQKNFSDMWWKNYQEECDKAKALKDDIQLVQNLLNRLTK